MNTPSATRAFRWLTAGVIGLGAAAWMSAGSHLALGAPPGLEELPRVGQLGADTTSYLYRMSWDELRARLQGTSALQSIENPEMEAFFNEVKRLGDRHEQFSSLYRFVLTALHQELVIAGASPGPAPPAAGEAKAAPDAGQDEAGTRSTNAAIVWPGPDSKATFRAEFDAMMKTINKWAGEIDTVEMGPVKFNVLGDKEDGVYTAWHDDRCYWAAGPEAARAVAEPAPGKKLAESDLFRATVGPLLEGRDGKPVALYYHDLRPGWRRLTANPQLAAAWSGLSWRSLDAVAGATFVEDNGYRNRHYWKVMPDLRTGLFKHSQAARVNRDWLKRVPAEASGFTTGVWDANSFILSLFGLYAKMMPGGHQMLAMAPSLAMPLAPLLKDVGPRYLVYRVPGKYGSFPLANVLPLSNMVVIAELDSPETFERNLDQLTAAAPSVLDVTFSGRKVKVINVMYLTVYITILEKELILTIHPQLMKDALANLDHPGPSIVDTPAYQAAKKYILPDACFELYMEPGGFCRGIYDQYIPALQQMISLSQGFGSFTGDDEEIPDSARGLNAMLFPRGSAMAGHVKQATILSARDDGDGVLFDGHAPVLCTPYYWVYLHALTRLHPPDDEGGIFELIKFLVMPLQPAEPAPPNDEPGFAP